MNTLTKDMQICEPPFEQWQALLEAAVRGASLPDLRPEVLFKAQQFESDLAALAKQLNLSLEIPAAFSSEKVVMTGHQPVVYHQGLIEKNRRLSQLAAQSKTSAINVIIDTDIEDCGIFRYPGPNRIEVFKFSSDTALIANQSVNISEHPQTPKELESIVDLYRKLRGRSISLANTLVRSLYEGSRCYLNVSLSSLIASSGAQTWFGSLCESGEELHSAYNRLLEAHRAARKIKNAANPFPNLAVAGADKELPFWRINLKTGSRVVHMLGAKVEADEFIAPRGAFVTVFLRLLCSDLFIHGLGGAKYDLFTNQLISEFFRVPVPPFTVASRTELLFTKERSEHQDALEFKEQIPSMHSHLDDYLSDSFLSQKSIAILSPLNEKRGLLLSELKDKKARGEDVKEVAVRLKDIDNQMKTQILIDAVMLARADRAEVSKEKLELWYSREYPFFLSQLGIS